MAEFVQHQFSVFTSSKESQKGVLCARGSQTFSSLWAEHFAMLRTRDFPGSLVILAIICSWFAHHLPHFLETKPYQSHLSNFPESCTLPKDLGLLWGGEVQRLVPGWDIWAASHHSPVWCFVIGRDHGKSILVFGYGLIPRYGFYMIFPSVPLVVCKVENQQKTSNAALQVSSLCPLLMVWQNLPLFSLRTGLIYRDPWLGTSRFPRNLPFNQPFNGIFYNFLLASTNNYPLLNIQKAIENDHRNSGFTH